MGWTGFFRQKQSPRRDLAQLVEALRGALGASLKSLLVFGSFASDEFHEGRSDVNVLAVVEPLTLDALSRLEKPLEFWMSKGHDVPIIVSLSELPLIARTHPIEFLDMKDRHQLLWGDDVLNTLTVDTRNLRAQCEHDLGQIAIKVRQALTRIGSSTKGLRELLIRSVPSTLTLFRAAWRLQDGASKLNKIEAAERLAPLAGVEPLLLRQLHDFRFTRKTDDLPALVASYDEAIEKVRRYLANS